MKGRKATEIQLADKPAIEGSLVESDISAVSHYAQIAQSASIEQMRFSEWIGVRKGLSLVQKLLTVSDFKMLAEIKESRQYKGLQVFGADGKPLTVSTFEQFCESQGLSRQHVDEGIRNLAAFGDAFIEIAQNMGVGYRDLRKLRQLPDGSREIVVNGVDALDRESLIDLIEEQSVKHAKEKESFAQQKQSLEDIVARKQRLNDHQADQIDELSAKARFVATCTPSEKLEGIRTELLQYATAIELNLVNQLAPALAALKAHQAEHGGECDAYLSSSLGQIERAVREIRENFGLLRAEDVAPWANSD